MLLRVMFAALGEVHMIFIHAFVVTVLLIIPHRRHRDQA
jgi:hypothetical protein